MINTDITKGMAARGTVAHGIKGVGTFGLPVSYCGRWVVEGECSDVRLCRTCVRIGKIVEVKPIEVPQHITSEPQQYISWEYSLSSEELAATQAKVDKINDRCAKRGVPGGLNVEWEEVTKFRNDFGVRVEWVEYKTRITGIAPKFDGWVFTATIDHDPYAGLIVRTYPGVRSIDRSEIREGYCAHCKTTRYRKHTYVMKHTVTGEQIQVGSSCIKDFTGWTALPVSFDKFSEEMEEMSAGFGGGTRDYTTKTVLSIAWACVQNWGYVKRGAYEGVPTIQRVYDVLNPPKQGKNPDRLYLAELESLRERAAEMPGKAEELIAWIASDEFSGSSEYVLNLKAIAGAEMVSSRNYGLLVSAPQAWARFQEKTLIRAVEAKPVSEWQGEIKEALTLTATVEAIRYIDGDYGVSTLYKLRDDAGNLFEWFASRDVLGEDTGVKWAFTATVKAHKEWKGHKTTQLTRVRKASVVA